jgi:hypothetical protein
MAVFWDVAPYNLVDTDRRFGGAYCLYQQVVYTHSLQYANMKIIVTRIYIAPYERVLLDKLIVVQLFKRFEALYGTRRFITLEPSNNSLFTVLTQVTVLAVQGAL